MAFPQFVAPISRFSVILAVLLLVTAGTAAAQATDHIGVPCPIAFAGETYVLAYRLKPSPGYTKQEYVPAGQTVRRYHRMVLVERLTGNVGVTGVVGAQIRMLKQRKLSDPLVNFELIENRARDEVILDFVLSGKAADGQIVVEWNAYRYSRAARGGVLLFGISHRAYGDAAARDFLGKLKALRPSRIAALAGAALPDPAD